MTDPIDQLRRIRQTMQPQTGEVANLLDRAIQAAEQHQTDAQQASEAITRPTPTVRPQHRTADHNQARNWEE